MTTVVGTAVVAHLHAPLEFPNPATFAAAFQAARARLEADLRERGENPNDHPVRWVAVTVEVEIP